MRILVTGGAGFIGSHLCEALVARGHEVKTIDIANRTGNVRNYPLVSIAVDSVDFVFHLAAALGVKKIIKHPYGAMRTNVTGTSNVMTACSYYRVPVLFTSSSEVYGKSPCPFQEDDDLTLGTAMRWSYAASKLIDEFMALASDAPAIVARIFNTVGPRQSSRYGMVLPTFVEQATSGKPITVHGSGQQTRCFCDVRDTVEALIRLMEAKCYGQIVNVGNPQEISIENLARKVKQITGSDSPIEYVPYDKAYGPGYEDMQRRVPSIRKLYELTGFAPSIPLSDTIRSLVESPVFS